MSSEKLYVWCLQKLLRGGLAAAAASYRVVVSQPAWTGWAEQQGPTCGAASVAGAFNGLLPAGAFLSVASEPNTAPLPLSPQYTYIHTYALEQQTRDVTHLMPSLSCRQFQWSVATAIASSSALADGFPYSLMTIPC